MDFNSVLLKKLPIMSMGGKTKIIMELNIVQSIIDTTNYVND